MKTEETMERKETVAERFHISDERGFVERLASLALSDGFEAEQIRNIRSIAQHLLMARAASTPEAAGRSDLPFDEKDALLTLLRERPMKATEIHRRMFGPYSESKLNEQVVMMLLGGELRLSADRHLSIAPPSPNQAAVSEPKD